MLFKKKTKKHKGSGKIVAAGVQRVYCLSRGALLQLKISEFPPSNCGWQPGGLDFQCEEKDG